MSAWDSMWITPEASWVCSGAIRCRARSMPSPAGTVMGRSAMRTSRWAWEWTASISWPSIGSPAWAAAAEASAGGRQLVEAATATGRRVLVPVVVAGAGCGCAVGLQAASRSTPVAIATATATRWLGLSLLLAVAARGRRRMGGLVMAALLLRTWDADAQGGCWRLNAAAGQRSLRPARSAAL